MFIAILSIFWLGILIGVSFVATPAKFLATTLTLPVALEVGRETFHIFNSIEFIILGALFLTLVRNCKIGGKTDRTSNNHVPKRTKTLMHAFLILLLFTIMLTEVFWLRPILDLRIGAIIAGSTEPPSIHHTLYIVLECLKIPILIALAWQYLRNAPKSCVKLF